MMPKKKKKINKKWGGGTDCIDDCKIQIEITSYQFHLVAPISSSNTMKWSPLLTFEAHVCYSVAILSFFLSFFLSFAFPFLFLSSPAIKSKRYIVHDLLGQADIKYLFESQCRVAGTVSVKNGPRRRHGGGGRRIIYPRQTKQAE